MAYPTAVNSQVTDSIAQANTKVLGDAPALSSGELYVASGQALSNAAHNATINQAQCWTTAQAALTAGVKNLMVLETASDGKAARAILSSPANDPVEQAIAITASSQASLGL